MPLSTITLNSRTYDVSAYSPSGSVIRQVSSTLPSDFRSIGLEIAHTPKTKTRPARHLTRFFAEVNTVQGEEEQGSSLIQLHNVMTVDPKLAQETSDDYFGILGTDMLEFLGVISTADIVPSSSFWIISAGLLL